jgi:uncharacterized integral membrane protein
MIFKKKFLLLIFFLIIIFQTLLYTKNIQRASFRYFKWTIPEVSIGKLISISFFSGLLISTILNTTLISHKKNTLEKTEENYESSDNEEDFNSNINMPPERDIRDAQPTISVNYRVVKNAEENNSKMDQSYSDTFNNNDDWINQDNEW